MNRRIAFPFLTLTDIAVDASPWLFSLNDGDWQQLGDFLPDWDTKSLIRIRRTLSVDPLIAADNLGVQLGTFRLSLGVRIGTGPGRLPKLILLREWRELETDTWREDLDLEITGKWLSHVLDIQTQLMLAAQAEDCDPLSPTRIADRLWSDTRRIRLEGEEPRFPIEFADFKTLFGDSILASTPWYLHWTPLDWNRDFHGAVRLYLNKHQPDFIEKMLEHDRPTLQVLLSDVMGQICERFVSDSSADEIIMGAEPGSLGAQAAIWLKNAWPGKNIDFIRSELENRPGKFWASLLTLAETGEM